MPKIGPGDYIISHDDEIGVVCSTVKGRLKITTPAHAAMIQKCIEAYSQLELSETDQEALEAYLYNAFGHMPDLQLKPCPSLFDRDVIRRLEIMVANDCNLNCKYCYAHAGTYGHKTQRLDAETARKYLSAFLVGKYTYVETVMFFGGEPTLCPDTIKAVCEFFEENTNQGIFKQVPTYTMVTNGTLIDERMAAIISKYAIRVTVSVDGPQEINDLLRVDKENNGTFRRIERGIKILNKYNAAPVLLEATFTKKHLECGYSPSDVKAYLSEHFDVSNILVAPCGEGGREPDLAMHGSSEAFGDNRRGMRLQRILSTGIFSDISCDAGFGSVALMPNGEVYPCHFFAEHPEYRIAYYDNGTFNFSDYDNILTKLSNAHRLQNLRCTKCRGRVACRACPASLLLFDHDDKFCEEECQSQEKFVLHCAREQIRENAVCSAHIQE